MARHHRTLLRKLAVIVGSRLLVRRVRGFGRSHWRVQTLLTHTPWGPVYGRTLGDGWSRREALADARMSVAGGSR